MLATPLRLPSGAVLPNRLAKSAMSEVLAEPETGAPTDALIRLYERWSRSGAGLLITGNVMVDPDGLGEAGNVVVTDDRHLPLLRRWATAAQAHGAKVWVQLNHAGRQSPKKLTREPVAPSAVPLRGMRSLFAKPRALTDLQIERIIGRFAVAASVVKRAGFSGVQLHAAHGYLVSQFLSPRTNQRTDRWGGDLANRARFLLEIVRAMREAVGPAFPIGVKLNSADFQRGGFSVDEAMQVAVWLEQEGVDLLEVSGGNYESPAMAGSGELPAEQRESSRDREAYFLDYARLIRERTKLPILLTGGMRSRAVMDRALASGAVDVIGLARPRPHTPDLPALLLAGSLAAAPTVKIRSRVRIIDDALQVMWFQAQIHEMARGREPDLRMSKLRAFCRGLWHGYSPFGRRAYKHTPLLEEAKAA